MNRFRRSGRTVGFLLGIALFVVAPFAVSAAQGGLSLDRDSIRQNAQERIQMRIAADERLDSTSASEDTDEDTSVESSSKKGHSSNSFGNFNNFPGKLCPSTIKAGWLSVPVFLPCKNTPPPPPTDACPNVPGNQSAGPCLDQQCIAAGGTWDGDSCEFTPPPVDVCPNVPGTQTSGPCADQQCTEGGGTWDGDSCNFPQPTAPTLTFSANPTSVQMGSSSLLTWDSTNATSCTASNGWSGSKAVDGSQSVTPSATTMYQLECVGAGGTTTQSVVVNVVPVTPEPEDPELIFTAGQSTINEGATTTLSWDSTNANSCVASGGWSGSKAVDGSEVVGPTATTTYTLTCTGDGGSVAVSLTVNVILDEEPAPTGAVVLSEVMYDLTTSTTSPQGSETANEWIEIYNGTNSSIDLSNYSITDASSTDPLPAATVPAGKYAVIVASSTTASFWTIPGDAVVVQLANTTIGNGLGNAGDMVTLFDEVASSTIDAVSWGNNTTAFSPSVPVVEVNAGHSIARTSVTTDTNTAADWVERTVPNPGQ